jgi:PPOX class probable FMN-dependent enzyme
MKSMMWGGESLEIAETEEEFRSLYQPPSQLVLEKCLSELDEHCCNFIAHAPFLCMGTADADGAADVTPRGDAPGFVRVLDRKTLFIPDRLGNNRLDSMSNLTRNPHVGLIFFVPGVDETLRVNGLGRIVVRSGLLDRSAVNGKTPKTGILVEVREAFLQCAKALRRSKLWSGDYRVPDGKIPSLGQMLVDQTSTKLSVAELDKIIDEAYRDRMY